MAEAAKVENVFSTHIRLSLFPLEAARARQHKIYI